MFFSHFLLLSATSAIYAMTTQEAEQRVTSPLLLPLSGKPEELKMKIWYWEGNDRQSMKSKSSFISWYYQSKQIVPATKTQVPKTVVFGSWDYVDAGAGRPSSALTFANDENPRYLHDFCIKNSPRYDTYLRRLLRQFDNKMISFWWDSTTPIGLYRGTSKEIAELAIGGVNPSRFVAGTEMRVQLAPARWVGWDWSPVEGTNPRVGDTYFNQNPIWFRFQPTSRIPIVIYNAITKPLRDEMRYTVGLMKGYGRNINGGIMKYLDFNEPIDVFDCKDAQKLLPLHIGELTIPPSMMYSQISVDKCKMTLEIKDNLIGLYALEIGLDLIRRFYLTIIYDSANGASLQFTTRR